MDKVLLIEDDPAMLRGLKDNFAAEGYRVETASDGAAGLEKALRMRPDLIILDVMLPKMNGYELCAVLRKEGIEASIIMLTARTQESDAVLGLKLGADDYVKKPFGIRELLARSEAFLRRRRQENEPVITFGSCRIEVESHRLYRNNGEVLLSPREFALLHYLASRPGRVLSREQILRDVWGYDRLVTPRSIDRFVTGLRKKIEDNPRAPVFIQTVREVGYRFEG